MKNLFKYLLFFGGLLTLSLPLHPTPCYAVENAKKAATQAAAMGIGFLQMKSLKLFFASIPLNILLQQSNHYCFPCHILESIGRQCATMIYNPKCAMFFLGLDVGGALISKYATYIRYKNYSEQELQKVLTRFKDAQYSSPSLEALIACALQPKFDYTEIQNDALSLAKQINYHPSGLSEKLQRKREVKAIQESGLDNDTAGVVMSMLG